MSSIPIVGKCFSSAASFLDYLEAVHFAAWRPQFVTMHHTGAPSLQQWRAWQVRKDPVTDQEWLSNLASYYGNEMRWSAGPHFFFTPRNFCVLTPPWKRGVHAVSFNAMSWGVECVGDFDVEPFTDDLRDRYAEGLACLHIATGLTVDAYIFKKSGLHFHRDDPKTTKTCPGKHVGKTEMVAAVKAKIKALAGSGDHDDEHVEEKTSPQMPLELVTGRVNVDDLNVRASATQKAPIVRVLEKGASIAVTGEAMNGPTKWLQIEDGWVSARYVDL